MHMVPKKDPFPLEGAGLRLGRNIRAGQVIGKKDPFPLGGAAWSHREDLFPLGGLVETWASQVIGKKDPAFSSRRCWRLGT